MCLQSKFHKFTWGRGGPWYKKLHRHLSMEYTDKRPSQQRFKKYSSFFITARDKFVHHPRSIMGSNDKHAKQLKFTLVISNSRDTMKTNKSQFIYFQIQPKNLWNVHVNLLDEMCVLHTNDHVDCEIPLLHTVSNIWF